MINYYKKTGKELQQVSDLEENIWINIYPPFNEEKLKDLTEKLSIPFDFLIDSLDIDERSRFEKETGARLMVIKTPILNEMESEFEAYYITIPIGIILCGSVIITISAYENPVINKFLKTLVKNFDSADREKFVLQIFERNVDYFLHCLQEINNKRNGYEKELYNSMRNRELSKLLNLEKALVYFVTSLRTNEMMMLKMQRTDFLRIKDHEEYSDIFQDILIDYSQALEMANIYTHILNGTMDAFASIISNNLNAVMKRLTAVTILLMLPTLVASFYGMNVDLPFQGNPLAFLYLFVFSLLIAFLLGWFLIRKEWF